MDQPSASILISAGDVSGDNHAGRLARRLLERDPELAIHALGGPHLRQAVAKSRGGMYLDDTTNCSAIGFYASLKIYFPRRAQTEKLRRFAQQHPLDLAILCDWGGVNRRLLRVLHAMQVPTLYYFPPASWSRGPRTGLSIAPFATRVATPFAWSAERLQRAGCRAEWVGHPVIERLPSAEKRAAVRQQLGLQPGESLVALLPGSRPSEIPVLAPKLARAADLLRQSGKVRAVAVVPQHLEAEARRYLPVSVGLFHGAAIDLLAAADAAVVKTGTATLEAAVAGTPFVAVYDVSAIGRLEWLIVWAWRWVPFVAMPNIVLQREVVPELIGPHSSPAKIAALVQKLLSDQTLRARMQEDFAAVRRELGAERPVSPTERTAQIAEELLAIRRPIAAASA